MDEARVGRPPKSYIGAQLRGSEVQHLPVPNSQTSGREFLRCRPASASEFFPDACPEDVGRIPDAWPEEAGQRLRLRAVSREFQPGNST